jgi:hypothetical protein
MNPEIKAEYDKLRNASPNVVRCAYCKALLAKANAHPHHAEGRHGAKLLIFFWVCPLCHLGPGGIHDRPAKAKALGLYHPDKTEPPTSNDS